MSSKLTEIVIIAILKSIDKGTTRLIDLEGKLPNSIYTDVYNYVNHDIMENFIISVISRLLL